MNKWDFLLEIFIQNNACFPRTSKESNMQIPSVELFEYLNVSIIILTNALVELRSSLHSESDSSVHGNARQKAVALNSSVATLIMQGLRAEATLSAIQYLLKTLSGNEVCSENDNAEAGVSEVVQITLALHEELAEFANRSSAKCNKQTVITRLADSLEEYQHKFTSAVYALLDDLASDVD